MLQQFRDLYQKIAVRQIDRIPGCDRFLLSGPHLCSGQSCLLYRFEDPLFDALILFLFGFFADGIGQYSPELLQTGMGLDHGGPETAADLRPCASG